MAVLNEAEVNALMRPIGVDDVQHHTVLDGAVAEGPLVRTRAGALPVLGRPVGGSDWIAASGPSVLSHHRMGLIVAGGLAQLSRRFAFDFRQVKGGASFAGDARDVRAHHVDAQRVFAVADGQFASYAHLQPGSVQVKPGERVKRGQWLGRVGNSGDAREPHLHFQLTSGPNILASEGAPFVFEQYRMKAPDGEWETRSGEYPMGPMTIDFGP